MKIINTKNAPNVVGPYSQAIISNGFIFCSGQIGIDPLTGNLVGGFTNQINQVLKNVKAVLEAANSSLDMVVKTTIFIKNMTDYPELNKIYGEYFLENKPARSTVEVLNLPKDALVEIELIAIEK